MGADPRPIRAGSRPPLCTRAADRPRPGLVGRDLFLLHAVDRPRDRRGPAVRWGNSGMRPRDHGVHAKEMNRRDASRGMRVANYPAQLGT